MKRQKKVSKCDFWSLRKINYVVKISFQSMVSYITPTNLLKPLFLSPVFAGKNLPLSWYSVLKTVPSVLTEKRVKLSLSVSIIVLLEEYVCVSVCLHMCMHIGVSFISF